MCLYLFPLKDVAGGVEGGLGNIHNALFGIYSIFLVCRSELCI